MTISIRRATPADAAGYARIMSDPAVYPGLMQLPFNNEAAVARAPDRKRCRGQGRPDPRGRARRRHRRQRRSSSDVAAAAGAPPPCRDARPVRRPRGPRAGRRDGADAGDVRLRRPLARPAAHRAHGLRRQRAGDRALSQVRLRDRGAVSRLRDARRRARRRVLDGPDPSRLRRPSLHVRPRPATRPREDRARVRAWPGAGGCVDAGAEERVSFPEPRRCGQRAGGPHRSLVSGGHGRSERAGAGGRRCSTAALAPSTGAAS